MKYLLVALVVGIGFWLWRRGRTSAEPMPPTKPESKPAASGSAWMVRCKLCGVHLPQSEAVVSEQGVFCSEAHRSKA